MGKFTKYMFSGGSWLASEDMTFAMVYDGRITSAAQQHSLTAFPCWLGIDIIEMTAEEAGTLATGGYTGGGLGSRDKTLSIICSKSPVLATTTTTISDQIITEKC